MIQVNIEGLSIILTFVFVYKIVTHPSIENVNIVGSGSFIRNTNKSIVQVQKNN